MLPQEIIRRKRDGAALTSDEIDSFIAGLTFGSVTGEQAAAFAMTVFFRGMTRTECAALTKAMARSGMTFDWRGHNLGGPVLDKHSTGGVGDNVSLILAPLIAACGGFVPMISGRGLGHTGGTLDKLESIRGYNATPDAVHFARALKDAGCAISGQTDELAPADRRLYAIRDVTATVESIPLITASILSKKIAAGLGALVIDVKTGNGAFMATLEDARALAQSLGSVAAEAGLPTVSVMTDMNEPLASAAGNAVEVRNAVDFLTGKHRDPRLLDVVLALGAEMLLIGRLADDTTAAHAKLIGKLDNGAAAERFARMVAALDGPRDILENSEASLPSAAIVMPVTSVDAGFVATIDTRGIGLAVVALGGGRTRPQDGIDHAVGLTHIAGRGARVEAGEPLCLVHAHTHEAAEAAMRAVRAAYHLGETFSGSRNAVIETVRAAS